VIFNSTKYHSDATELVVNVRTVYVLVFTHTIQSTSKVPHIIAKRFLTFLLLDFIPNQPRNIRCSIQMHMQYINTAPYGFGSELLKVTSTDLN
jgi:hypothetical protein